MYDYLTLVEVLEMQKALVKRYGGEFGVRDLGALESALSRVQSDHYPDIISRAAALMESIVLYKPFKEGNKRTAFAAIDAFLRMNGYSIHQRSDKIYDFFIQLIKTQQFEIENIAHSLRQVTVKV
jgi:death on curing protein